MFLRIAYLISESPNKTEFILLIASFKSFVLQEAYITLFVNTVSLKLIQITKISIQTLIFSGLVKLFFSHTPPY